MCQTSSGSLRRALVGRLVPVCGLLFIVAVEGYARDLTYEQALEIALTRSARGRIIHGDLEVARKNYFAEKVNFYVPEISLNASTPTYSVDKSYRFFGGQRTKRVVKTDDLDFSTNIQLQQSLFTGGLFTVRANLLRNDAQYPLFNDSLRQELRIDELTQSGFFDFEIKQPILKPSDSRHDLHNEQDDLEIAKVTFYEEQAGLRSEVTEAYFGLLQLAVEEEIAVDNLRSASLTSDIDSLKFADGVVAEEDWLQSASLKLDSELMLFDIRNQKAEQARELTTILDLDATEKLNLGAPTVPDHFSDDRKNALVQRWEVCLPITKAEHQYARSERSADYAASGHGLNGDLTATYSFGRSQIDGDLFQNEDVETGKWAISLNLTYPIWDGGASGAQVQAARLEAEKARLEYERTVKAAKAEIINLINRVDVGYRKLEVLQKQIEMTRSRMDIARFRFEDGQISEVKFLESKIAHLEARNKYLEELKNYLLDRIKIDSKYSS